MIQTVDIHIEELKRVKATIKPLYYIGNQTLLHKRKVSIVGTRRPNQYTKTFTAKLSQELSNRGVVTVSGAAMGVDAITHKFTKNYQTIAVVANGLDIRYPKTNQNLIQEIENNGLMLSQFESGYKARAYSFVQRNEIVVALGEVLIITQAGLNSGSLRSAEYAIKQGKEIYVLPHRIDESLGTQQLLKEGLAKPIYDLEKFVNQFGTLNSNEDEFLSFCKQNPHFETVYMQHEDKILEYELAGRITIDNGIITVVE